MTEAPGSEFEYVRRTRGSKGRETFEGQLLKHRETVRSSEMFKNLKKHLEPHRKDISRVRCLAIGSFHEEFAALYQLGLLLETCDYLASSEDKPIRVSIYDPVFTKSDQEFIKNAGSNWSIDEETPWESSEAQSVLYFLPHAPLDLSERVMTLDRPYLWLANHIVKHTDRYTKLQLFDKYPVLSKLLNSVTDVKESVPGSDFQPFVSRKNRRRNKMRVQERVIDYTSVPAHFSKCSILTDFGNGKMLADQPWVNSFSDLTLHIIE
ncbi:LAQU0S01e01970g1_1 [Lachancea quebecensis]|uniref:LAQU0S01e01970g1_1 n=1 Tax=Lachancea quebecensis TaxID=1654605 RepID=A0A0P1KUP9_9SACH|nr:LAQU0S01e01970g1_1 [Lachancea quebecensis]